MELANSMRWKLTNKAGQQVPNSELGGKVVALYFSAHWCPPCQGFTPMLKKFYEAANGSGDNLQIVFVSSDRSEAEGKDYFANHHGDWLMLDVGPKGSLVEKYGVRGIPSLIVVDSSGKSIAENARDQVVEAAKGSADDVKGVLAEWTKSTFPGDNHVTGSQARSVTFSTPKEATGFGEFVFRRLGPRGNQVLMGKCKRSAVTGEVWLRSKVDFPDYSIVDLYTRYYLVGNLHSFSADQYLFRPVPLLYRTWMYHVFNRRQQTLQSSRDYGMLVQVLEQRCIDAPVSAGRWSPVMCHGPMVLVLAFAGDLSLALVGAFYFVTMFYIGVVSNNPEWYRYTRVLSAPMRLAFLALIFWRFGSSEANALAVLSYIVVSALYLMDFIVGDVSAILNFRHHCHYEIIKTLPNRVVVCKRHGAAHYEDSFGSRGSVPEVVSGMGDWGNSYMLIADLHGILTELRPMGTQDWKTIWEERDRNVHVEHKFVGLDVYCDEIPTKEALDAAGEEQERLANLKKSELQQLGGDVLMENL